MSCKGKGRAASSSEKHLWTLIVRLVLASTAIKYAKHLTGRLAFRLEEHFRGPNAVLIAASLSKPAILTFFQIGMCSQPPQYLTEPMVYAVPLIAPCLMLAPSSPDSRDKWNDSQRNIRIRYLS